MSHQHMQEIVAGNNDMTSSHVTETARRHILMFHFSNDNIYQVFNNESGSFEQSHPY